MREEGAASARGLRRLSGSHAASGAGAGGGRGRARGVERAPAALEVAQTGQEDAFDDRLEALDDAEPVRAGHALEDVHRHFLEKRTIEALTNEVG